MDAGKFIPTKTMGVQMKLLVIIILNQILTIIPVNMKIYVEVVMGNYFV